MYILNEKCIVMDLQSKNKEGALNELAQKIHDQLPEIETDSLYKLLRDREQIGSTGVGNGVAIPHAKIDKLDHTHLCFGRSHNGIGFDAIDNQPVHLLIMIVSPLGRPNEYLKILASVSRLLKQPEIRRRLRTAENTEEIIELFQQSC